jgi:hypothetical protein
MKSWSYTVGNPLGYRETIKASTEEEAKNIIYDLHSDRRVYPVAGRWGVEVNQDNNQNR